MDDDFLPLPGATTPDFMRRDYEFQEEERKAAERNLERLHDNDILPIPTVNWEQEYRERMSQLTTNRQASRQPSPAAAYLENLSPHGDLTYPMPD